MEILKDIGTVSEAFRSGVLAIGNFDGVHQGHQAILNAAKSLAKTTGHAKAGVMCFEPHPRAFFNPDKTLFSLTPIQRKLDLFESFGMDFAVVLPFNKDLAALSAADFIQNILVESLGVSKVVVGYDFHFAKNRSGTPEFLKHEGKVLGFDVTIIEQQNTGSVIYSSSQVRQFLREGEVRKAAELLGHWWRVSGNVERGAQNGEWLGFPTANIQLLPGQELGHGVYAVRVYIDKVQYLGAAYMGQRPTFDNGAPALETFIFDFEGDLYGKTLEIELIEFVRHDQKFDSIELLKEQMYRDCNTAKEHLTDLDSQEHGIKSL